MDRSTLIARVAARLNITSDDPLYADLGDLINEAIHYLDTSSPDGWPWMRTTINTTVTTGTYTFSQLAGTTSTVAKILSAKVKDGDTWQILRFRNQDEIDQLYPTDDAGLPESYAVDGGQVGIYPPPDGTYQLRLRVVFSENDLSAGTDTPVMPESFHTGIVDAALLFAYQSLADTQRVTLQEQRVIAMLQRMRTYGIQYDPSPTIRVRQWL